MRYIYDKRTKRMIPVVKRRPTPTLQVIPDVEPFQVPDIEGTVLGSRREIRDYERAHGVRQCGNDYPGNKPSWWDNR